MTLLRFTGVGREFGPRWVLRDVSFDVSAGDRWGITGRNGAGKTTLLRLVLGEDEATEGEIWRHPGQTFSLLRQGDQEARAAGGEGQTVYSAALRPFASLLAIERRMHATSEALAGLDSHSAGALELLARYDRDLEEFRRADGYALRARAEATLQGLGFGEAQWETALPALSGGERGRLRLVQSLLATPDVLLLDEPTNHLDLASTEWLESFLPSYAGTVLVVSHDRVFLRRIAGHKLEIADGGAEPYSGGYDSFVVQREERRVEQQRAHERQQALITRTEDFVRRNLAGQKTKQAQSRRTMLERLDRIEAPAEERGAMALDFGAASRSGSTVLRLASVSHRFGDRTLFRPFSSEVHRGDRVVITGANGSGKSTLMRAIAGDLAPDGGEIVRGTGVRLSVYRQDLSHLDPGKTIWDEIAAAAPAANQQTLRGHLARFLFRGDDLTARIGTLSGGERARVALAKITLESSNLLLLDEPTNHLDIPSREALEEALAAFAGTILLISHDRALLFAVATRVWALTPPTGSGGALRIVDHRGTFDEWVRDAAARARDGESPPRPASSEMKPVPASGPDAQAGELSKNEIRRRERMIAELEKRITRYEGELEELERELADPALYAGGGDPGRVRQITELRDAASARLPRVYAEWERIGEELAGV